MGDQNWYNKVLGLHMNGTNGSTTFTDVKGKTMTAYGNARISTAQYPALTGKSSSGYFDGTGDYLTTPYSADFSPGSGDFSVFAFIRPASVSTLRAIVGAYTQVTYTHGWLLYQGPSGELALALRDSTGNLVTVISSAGVLTLDSWQRVGFTKQGMTYRIFVGGTKVAEGTNSISIYVHASHPLIVGRWDDVGTNTRDFIGYMSEVEVFKGVAVETADYTPPAAPFLDEYVSVSGTTKDLGGSFASRLVRAYRQDTGAFVGAQLSNATTGAYKIEAANTGATVTKHFVVMHDDDANPPTTSENALIYDNITPA